ncbi:hypothetical protein Q4Q54_17685 [Shewanella sp. SP2S2-4]|uniref:hypothetical protein n=1 Tax=Shewanella sp. SP2S2-4 TaxID=3063539 RepID=UPI002891AECF|nr:hypothetical protein [Shewanella sp. SP2S2-4]MDT3275296.1 hypothetical protein [Shewanella sp. SP2S2-4]
MNKLILSSFLIIIAGCSAKLQYIPGATGIQALSNSDDAIAKCVVIGTSSIESQHPNNFRKAIANTVYMEGGTHYKIISTDESLRGKITGAAFDIYKCSNI